LPRLLDWVDPNRQDLGRLIDPTRSAYLIEIRVDKIMRN